MEGKECRENGQTADIEGQHSRPDGDCVDWHQEKVYSAQLRQEIAGDLPPRAESDDAPRREAVRL